VYGSEISDGEMWMSMIQSRNISSHTYDEDTAESLFIAIVSDYYPLFTAFKVQMESLL